MTSKADKRNLDALETNYTESKQEQNNTSKKPRQKSETSLNHRLIQGQKTSTIHDGTRHHNPTHHNKDTQGKGQGRKTVCQNY